MNWLVYFCKLRSVSLFQPNHLCSKSRKEFVWMSVKWCDNVNSIGAKAWSLCVPFRFPGTVESWLISLQCWWMERAFVWMCDFRGCKYKSWHIHRKYASYDERFRSDCQKHGLELEFSRWRCIVFAKKARFLWKPMKFRLNCWIDVLKVIWYASSFHSKVTCKSHILL